MSTGYKILVMLHILCVIGGFGAVAYNGLYLSLAQRRAGGGTGAILEVNRLVSGFAEVLMVAAVLFGIGAVTQSHKAIKFSDGWISAAFALFVVAMGVLHGFVKPRQRKYQGGVGKLEAGGGSEAERVAEAKTLLGLEKQVSAGWAVFNILVIAAVYLMIFKPGS